ncbi:hypothetical protein [Azorhizobium doebereinerae]|uniref:hypothetical protein n=1 Tax=Azorhizobium doebereinerae TaxID=281091 RepID=UPI000406D215|nr:hypothetical protein [Azorhizobium doebereinerae]
MAEITSTYEMAENEWDSGSEPRDVPTSMVATTEREHVGIEFHVSMRDYTKRDMDDLIVEAAARLIVGNYGTNKLAKLIEERCVALTVEKVDQHLAGITAEIIDQPVTPAFGDKKPVTMREFIGLYGREYLTERVDSEGKPTRDSYRSEPRITWLANRHMARTFTTEIEKATNAAIVEIRALINAKHKEALEAEKARIRDALARVTA